MSTYLNYLLEANLGLCLFLFAYKILFARETDFAMKRIVLLSAVMCSLVFPLISFNTGALDPTGQIMPTVWLPELTLNEVSMTAASTVQWSFLDFIIWVYAGGVVVFLTSFLFNIYHLIKVIRITKPQERDGLLIAETERPLPPFSFFRFVIIGNTSALDISEKRQIIAHERVHAERYHSMDVLLINVVGVFFWFNPVIYLYKKLFIQLHEFEADSRAVRNESLNEYCSLLARVALLSADLRIANHFSNSLTLKRIQMMRRIKLKTKPWKLAMMALGASVFFVGISCSDGVMTEVAEVAQDSHVALNVPPHVQDRYDFLVKNNPFKKYIIVEMGATGEQTIRDLESKYGLPGSVEVFKTGSEPVTGSSESGVVIRNSSKSNEVAGYLILEFDENAKKMIDLSRQDDVYTIVDESASFPGGMDALYKFVGSEISYPEDARKKGISGKVFIEFIVEPDGSVTNVGVKKSLHESIDQEAVRVITNSPKWIPGKQNGKAVRQKLVLPVVFSLGNAPLINKTSEFRDIFFPVPAITPKGDKC